MDPLLAFFYIRFDPITASFLYGLVFSVGVVLFVHAVGAVVKRLTGGR